MTFISDGKTASLLGLLKAARLTMPALALILGLILASGATVAGEAIPFQLDIVGWVLLIAGLVMILQRLYHYLFVPLISMQDELYHFNQGTPGVRVGDERVEVGVLDSMARDINSMIEELADLYDDMDNRVAKQTRRLAEKTASLKILYDVANNINEANSLDELLIRFLRVLKEMVNARAATVRLAIPGGQMRIVACIGLDDKVKREKEILPIRLCRCGVALTPGDILCEHDPEQCAELQGRQMFGSSEVELIEVPMSYHEEVLGLYRLYLSTPGISDREEVMEMLHTIGRHLGMAVAKQHSDEEAHRLSIIEERTALAHELHDSLAQTIAGLRFQVRMLTETLDQEGRNLQAKEEAVRILNAVDEAHFELRELLNSFRAPMDERGLLPALENLVERFRQETGVTVFLQSECRQPQLSGSEEMQLLRIVQESLTNIRKHAQAHTVRLLLRCKNSTEYILLIEDDGVGFENSNRQGRPGEHIGLSILEERAQRLNGTLKIDSEPGEGTRVELTFHPSGSNGRAIEEICLARTADR